MEDKILEFCKIVVENDGNILNIKCPVNCFERKCPFLKVLDCTNSKNYVENVHIAKDYIGKHNKTVNTISSIEEQTITLDDLKDIKENNIVPKYYNKGNIDTIQFCLEYDLPFCIGNIIKYIVRYKDKNGLEDLKKAREYLERTMNYTLKYNCEIWEYIVCFCRENNLDYVQGKIIEFLMEKRIEEALSLINNLIIWEEKKESDINE